MKKLLVGLLVLGSISSFAGTLKMRNSLESIDFNYREGIVEVNSHTSRVESKDIKVSSIRRDKTDDLDAFNMTSAVNKESEYFGLFLPAIFPIAIAGDTVVLIFAKLPKKLIQNMRVKKDYKKLMKAVNNNNTVEVSEKRFLRICSLLKHAK